MVGTPGRSGATPKSSGMDVSHNDGPPIKPAMSEAAAAKWDALLGQLQRDALRKIDQHQLKILSELLAKFDVLSESDPGDLAAGRLLLSVAQHVYRLSAAFGLSPSDRMRLKVEPKQVEDDPFSELLERMQGK